MRSALVLTLIFGATSIGGCASEATTPEETATTQQAITNGMNADDPAIVALLRKGEVFCTGVLVNRYVVVTAAHCLADVKPDAIFFGMDPSDDNDGITLEVDNTRIHPDFDAESLENDVGLVGLASRAPVAPIPFLTSSFKDSYVGLPIRLVGFGASMSGGPTGKLRKRDGETKIKSFDEQSFRFMPGPSQTCNGDSGGPALAWLDGQEQEVIVGIASAGDSSCKTFGRDMRIDAYASFISDYTAEHQARASAPPIVSMGCSAASTSRAKRSGGALFATTLFIGCAAIARSRRRTSQRCEHQTRP